MQIALNAPTMSQTLSGQRLHTKRAASHPRPLGANRITIKAEQKPEGDPKNNTQEIAKMGAVVAGGMLGRAIFGPIAAMVPLGYLSYLSGRATHHFAAKEKDLPATAASIAVSAGIAGLSAKYLGSEGAVNAAVMAALGTGMAALKDRQSPPPPSE